MKFDLRQAPPKAPLCHECHGDALRACLETRELRGFARQVFSAWTSRAAALYANSQSVEAAHGEKAAEAISVAAK